MNKFSKFQADVICELHPLFKGLIWVSSAMSTDENRPVINNILVERKGLVAHIVATDGRRLHLHSYDPGMFDDDFQNIEPGLYEVVNKTKKLIVIAPSECGEKFPDWRQVVPEYVPTFEENFDPRSISKIAIRTGELLATDFVVDAIGFGCRGKKDSGVSVRYGSSGKGAAMVLEHDLGKAIVMPLRLDEATKIEEEPKTDAELTPDLPGISQEVAG